MSKGSEKPEASSRKESPCKFSLPSRVITFSCKCKLFRRCSLTSSSVSLCGKRCHILFLEITMELSSSIQGCVESQCTVLLGSLLEELKKKHYRDLSHWVHTDFQTSFKDEGMLPPYTLVSAHLLPAPQRRRTNPSGAERLSRHHLDHTFSPGRQLTWPYRDFAREISSWSPGVHIFKPMGSIFLSAATMREVWMEYRSPRRFVFFRSWSCPPD